MNSRDISLLIFARIASIVLLAVLLAGCSKKSSSDAPRRGGMKFPVEVAKVAARDVDLVVHAVGSVEAFEIVQVTARVPGVVQKVGFREGEAVNAGAQLVEIEPERYRLSLQSAGAAFEKAKASLREAQSGLTRRVDIEGRNPGFVSTEDLENWQTRVLSLQADSAQASADLDLARLNLRDAYVPAPVSGIIQSRTVRTGEYVQAGTVIATMVRRDPPRTRRGLYRPRVRS
jgi:multidrug efflux system membrane fusion protein